MADEKIFTQKEFDDKLGEVLSKKKKKYEDELAQKQTEIEGLNNQIKELNGKIESVDDVKQQSAKEIEELKTKIKGYETASVKRKVADEIGLGKDAVEFITGETEEEMKASAEKLKTLTGSFVPPLANNEQNTEDKITAAFRQVNESIKGGN